MKGTESFKQTIHSYLEQRASEDELFAEKYHAVNRSIDDIVTYILNQVQKSQCRGFDDDEIYSLAIHAAEEKDLEVGKQMECDVRVNHIVELTEEEKHEARRNAVHRLENERPISAFPTATSQRQGRHRPPPFSNHHCSTSKPYSIMKPRTEYQKMVCQSDKGTAPIAKRVIKWTADTLTEHYAYHHPNSLRHTCMDCGHQWTISDTEKENKTLVCPHCGRTLEVKDTHDRTLRQSVYFTMLTTRKGFQVLRVALLKT